MANAWAGARRLGGLRRFALAITVLNLLGHTLLGFEPSWAQPLVALAAAYAAELTIESLEAWSRGRRPRFAGGPAALVQFLLSAHISGLAVSMLLYANERLGVVAFASVTAIASKALVRVRVASGTCHVLNPSNFGISATLLLFPWVGIAPPYQFTERLDSARGDWILPLVLIASGTLLNARFTQRLPLIAAWLGGFALQGCLRAAWQETPYAAALLPMTGVAFLLFTFYMVTDPATTPAGTRGQVLFGAAVAASYALLMRLHVVFGLFFALSLVTAARGLGLAALAWMAARSARALERAPVGAQMATR